MSFRVYLTVLTSLFAIAATVRKFTLLLLYKPKSYPKTNRMQKYIDLEGK